MSIHLYKKNDKKELSHVIVTTEGINDQTMMTVKESMRGMVTSYAINPTQGDLNNGTNSNSTSASYSVDIEFSNGELIVTVVVPISLVITAFLVICDKWKLATPTRITMDYNLNTW